jgi:hypothetical protein
MSAPPGMIDWGPGEASSVNQFLNSSLGKKWLAILYSRKPKVDLKSTETAGLTGAYAAGYESFFTEIAATRASVNTESLSAKSIDPVKD